MNQLFALSLGIAAMAFAASQAQPLSPPEPALTGTPATAGLACWP